VEGKNTIMLLQKKKPKKMGKTLFTQTQIKVDGNSVFTILPFKEKHFAKCLGV
jgi:hypothetical protein